MIGSEGEGPDILGVEVTPTVVRAIRLRRGDRKVMKAAECPVLSVGDTETLDPSAIGPALDEVMYQLGVDDRTEHLAAVSIGPRRAGVGSGPALPAWLEHRARQLGENMISAGKLGISFCPQRALDTAIMVCEQANITVSRIDFAPVAAARVLDPGVETVTLGSGRGWRARLRDDEVLEALESANVAIGDPLMLSGEEGLSVSIDALHGISLGPDAKSALASNAGRFAVAVGTAVGVVDGSASNLLDGDTIRGREVPAAFSPGIGGINTGEIAGSRTTVNLGRAHSEPGARSVLRAAGTVVEPPGESLGHSGYGDENIGDAGVPDTIDGVGGYSVGEDVAKDDIDRFGYGAYDATGPDATNPDAANSDAASLDVTGELANSFDGGDSIDLTIDGSDGSAHTSADGLVGFNDEQAVSLDDSLGGADRLVDFDDTNLAFSEKTGGGLIRDVGIEDELDLGSDNLLESEAGYEPFGERQTGMDVHPDDPIRSFSPEPGAEHNIDKQVRGRGLALVVAGLILFSIAIAVGIIVTQG